MVQRSGVVALVVGVLCMSPAVALASPSTGHVVARTVLTDTTPPDANALLTAGDAAVSTANTFHIVSHIKVALGGLLNTSVTGSGDLQIKPAAAHLHVKGKLKVFGKAQKLNEEQIQIGKKSWVKDAQTHHKWAMKKSSSTTGVTPMSSNPLHVATNGDTITDLVNAGPATLGTVATWHLHGTYTAKIDATHSVAGTVDFYLGQADNLPYEVRVYVSDPQLHVLENLREVCSKFGESLSIVAPQIGTAH